MKRIIFFLSIPCAAQLVNINSTDRVSDSRAVINSNFQYLQGLFTAKQNVITGAPGAWPSTFTPSAHASTHAAGGSDSLTLDTSQITTGVFSSARIPPQTWASITGKPTFAAVAITGAYSDLSGTPTIYYQTIASNGTSLTQRATLNISNEFTLSDNPGSSRIDLSIGSIGVGKITGLGVLATQNTLQHSQLPTILAGDITGLGALATQNSLLHAQLPALIAADINAAGQITNNTTGNAATATALAATPTPCGTGLAARGVDASGNSVGCVSITPGDLPVYDASGNAITAVKMVTLRGQMSTSGPSGHGVGFTLTGNAVFTTQPHCIATPLQVGSSVVSFVPPIYCTSVGAVCAAASTGSFINFQSYANDDDGITIDVMCVGN